MKKNPTIIEELLLSFEKLEKLKEKYNYLCKEAKESIDKLCNLKEEIEKAVKTGEQEFIKVLQKATEFLDLLETEFELVFVPVKL